METNTFKHLFICYLSRGSYSCNCRYSLSRLLDISRLFCSPYRSSLQLTADIVVYVNCLSNKKNQDEYSYCFRTFGFNQD